MTQPVLPTSPPYDAHFLLAVNAAHYIFEDEVQAGTIAGRVVINADPSFSRPRGRRGVTRNAPGSLEGTIEFR